jgi:hypothetical protein
MEIQNAIDLPLGELLELLKNFSSRFHERHYLTILVKKHLIALYGEDLSSLSKEELRERLKLCEEVLTIYNYTSAKKPGL